MKNFRVYLRPLNSPITKDAKAFFGRWAFASNGEVHEFHVRLRSDGTIRGVESDGKELDPQRIARAGARLHGRFFLSDPDVTPPTGPRYRGYIGREHEDYCSVVYLSTWVNRSREFRWKREESGWVKTRDVFLTSCPSKLKSDHKRSRKNIIG